MGPPVAFEDRDDFKHHLKRQDLDSSGGAADASDAVERHLLGKLEEVKLQPECGHRHVVRLPGNTSELCVQRLITARPSAQQGRLLALFKYHWYLWNVESRHQQPQPGIPLPGILVFHIFGVQSSDSRQGQLPFPGMLFFTKNSKTFKNSKKKKKTKKNKKLKTKNPKLKTQNPEKLKTPNKKLKD